MWQYFLVAATIHPAPSYCVYMSTLEHVSLTCSSSDATPTICARVCRKGGIRGQFGPHITARTGATHCTNVYCMVTRNSYF